MALRVIAGTAGGRKLVAPKSGARPTQDRVKEALFSSLGDLVVDADVLDLYAGSGGLAIEALSRGAARAVLVDDDRAAVAAIRTNLATVGFEGQATVSARSADAFARAGAPGGPFDLVLLDPPYDLPSADLAAVLAALAAAGAVAPGATVVLERAAGSDPVALPEGWDVRRERTYGDTLLIVVSAPAD
ncbi:MAG: 16S rRNA (guanine(966)-N(2))-methyltransferase RsmD [Acidimicrobiia bacterium]